jgi:hypothetical protein
VKEQDASMTDNRNERDDRESENGIVLTEEQQRRRRSRSVALALALGALALLFFVITIVKLAEFGPGFLRRPM